MYRYEWQVQLHEHSSHRIYLTPVKPKSYYRNTWSFHTVIGLCTAVFKLELEICQRSYHKSVQFRSH